MEYKFTIPADEGRIDVAGNEMYTDITMFVGPDEDMCYLQVDVSELLAGIREIVKCVIASGEKVV